MRLGKSYLCTGVVYTGNINMNWTGCCLSLFLLVYWISTYFLHRWIGESVKSCILRLCCDVNWLLLKFDYACTTRIIYSIVHSTTNIILYDFAATYNKVSIIMYSRKNHTKKQKTREALGRSSLANLVIVNDLNNNNNNGKATT